MHAKCHICPLAKNNNKRASALRGPNAIIIDAPQLHEKQIGASSRYLDVATRIPGGLRDISIIPVLSCAIPGGDLREYQAKRKYKNRLAQEKGLEPTHDPVECCKPRFDYEVSQTQNLLLMGKTAHDAVGHPYGYQDALGTVYPLQHTYTRDDDKEIITTKSVITTYGVDNIRFLPGEQPLANIYTERFSRMIKNQLSIAPDPKIIINPSIVTLTNFVINEVAEQNRITYDIESEVANPVLAQMHLLGIGAAGVVLVFITYDTPEYGVPNQDYLREVFSILRRVWLDPRIFKIGQNSDVYDIFMLSRQEYIGVEPVNCLDTMQLHKLAYGEFPHNLGAIISQFEDSHAWKAVHSENSSESTAQYIEYNAYDVDKTSRIPGRLIAKVIANEQAEVYRMDERLNYLGRGMRRLGMRIDVPKLHELRIQKSAELYAVVAGLNQFAKINWNSPAQLANLWYDQWKLPVPHKTLSGAPSVDKDAVIDLMAETDGTDYAECIKLYRKYITLETALSMFLRPWCDTPGVVINGRIHAGYSATTANGRYASFDPNMQNVPSWMRYLFIPDDGNIFIYADKDQIEMRVVAAVANMTAYLDMFERQTIDPHNNTLLVMFGTDIWQLAGAPTDPMKKGSDIFASTRTLGKNIFFGSIYGARPPKVRDLVRRYKDNNGDLPYYKISQPKVTAMHQQLLSKLPELEVWWETVASFHNKHGYVREVIGGRRRYMARYEPTEGPNSEIQGAAFSDVALCMNNILPHIPFDYENRWGLVNQMHDGVLYSVPAARADYYKDLVTEKFSSVRQIGDNTINLSASAKVVTSWGVE